MEIVDEKDLKRYAVIDTFDIIAYDSDDLEDCKNFFEFFSDFQTFLGIYDYKEEKYVIENKQEIKHYETEKKKDNR